MNKSYSSEFKMEAVKRLEKSEVFYNRQRIHASNGYVTPEDYYNNANRKSKVA